MVHWIDTHLRENAGAVNPTFWVHGFFHYQRFPTQLAPQSGAMGDKLPAGVAAGLLHPNHVAVSLSGDGCGSDFGLGSRIPNRPTPGCQKLGVLKDVLKGVAKVGFKFTQ
ncbi:MAG TPA: thiamine pyrophosphate-dependent enzyme [Deferrisomatales bacterium]|nr:thiamine pyrophosphate-dependent enzyme [Deferrisomatales bacterium]